ncbi:MAG: hypothetical protein ACRELY_26725 [Polyangiaceae bacterium]
MKTIFASVMLATVVAAGACHRQAPPEHAGPVQKAGAAVDHAARNVKDAAKDTGHDVKRDLTK